MSDQDYLNYDPFEGDSDYTIACRTVKMVKTRKPQQCMQPEGTHHTIPAGTTARYETALIDGDHWGRYYTCCDCMDRWLTKSGIAAKAQPDQQSNEAHHDR